MDIEKPSFEKDLWGQCNKLHERLIKKIDYYKNLRKAFKPIQNSIDDLNEKITSLKFSMDPTIPIELYTDSKTIHSQSVDMESKWYSVPLTMQKIKEFILNTIDFNNQTLFHVVTNLEKLISKMKEEKNEYEEYQKSLKVLSDSKKVMDKNMKVYHQKMYAAEQSVLDLKKMEISTMSVNDATMIVESKDLLEEKANQLTNDAIKPFEIYQESVEKANALREDSINKQKHLLFTYQNIEEEVGKINTNISNIFFENLKFQKEFIEEKKNEIDNIKNNINIKKDVKQLILNFAGNEKPEEEILFINFPSNIDFDKSDTNETFKIYTQTVEFIKSVVNGEFPKYNEKLEEDKNNMREVIYKLFTEYSKAGEDKLLEFIKNKDTHNYFLILLSKLRTNNRFQQKAPLIELLGTILNKILEVAEQEKNYDNAKNCIILSQTFFCEKDNQKYYLLEKIRGRKWLKSVDFWFHFIDKMIMQEIDKFITIHPEITKDQILSGSEEITDKMKFKLSELLFSQLLPYVNNMNEFNVGLKNIIRITESFCEKYKFLGDEHKESIFGLVSDNKDEIERLRKECKKEKSLLITCNNNNTNKKVNNITKDSNINNSKNNANKNTNTNNNAINKTNENKNTNKDNAKNTNTNVNKNTNTNKNTNSNTNKNTNTNINKNSTNLRSSSDVSRSHTIAECNNISKNKTPGNEPDKKNNEGNFFDKFNPLKYLSNIGLNLIKEDKKEDKKEGKKEDKKDVKKEEKKDVKKEVKKEEKKEVKKEEKKEIKKDIKPENKFVPKKEEKIDKPVKKDTPMEKRAAMIKPNSSQNVNTNTNTNANPFGIVLKKVPK